MNCLFWNPRGVQAAGRQQAIIDLLNKTHANILGFQETKKETISDSYLKSLVGNRIFAWNSLPAIGSAGGILVGVDIDYFDIISWDIRDFSVTVVVTLKSMGLTVRVITVYGPSYEDRRDDFLSELHNLFLEYQGHTIIGGDFNLVRYQ